MQEVQTGGHRHGRAVRQAQGQVIRIKRVIHCPASCYTARLFRTNVYLNRLLLLLPSYRLASLQVFRSIGFSKSGRDVRIAGIDNGIDQLLDPLELARELTALFSS